MPCSCACRQHEKFSGGKDSPIHKIRNKKIKVDVLNHLYDNNLLPRHSNAICQLCIDYTQENFLKNKRKYNRSDEIVDSILGNEFGQDDLQKIAIAIGSCIGIDLDANIDKYNDCYKDHSLLTSFEISEWLNSKNPILVDFLKSVAGMSNSINRKKDMYIVSCIDNVTKARNLNYVAPLQFCNNLITYYLSSSKLVSQIYSRQCAGGSYQTLQRWLKNISLQSLKCNPSDDTVTFFDNNQVVARNWRVNYGYKSSASVITMNIHINPKLNSNLQHSTQHNPRYWLHNNDGVDIINKMTHYLNRCESDFNIIRNEYINSRMVKILNELSTEDGDDVERKLKGAMGPCQREEINDPYDWVPSCHGTVPEIIIGEPAMYNPCSYDSVTNVLKHIKDQTVVDSNRQWTCVGCDGLPYVLGSRLLDTNEELKDILLVPGHGHLEINAVKSCYKLLWDVCLQDLAKMLGFRSPRALVCCQNCTDHHKAWMILKIFMYGTLDEILVSYVSCAVGNHKTPSVAGLYNYIAKSTDNNFRFMCDVLLNYVIGLFVFRCGVRRNNSKYIMAGKSKFMKLFYVFNQTYYQEIMYRDLKTKILAPNEVKVFLEKTESFSISGHKSKGEGGDFVLEAVNGRAKRWLPPGIPQKHHWVKVCRNLDILEKIKENTFKEIDLAEKNEKMYQRDISTEVMEWRCLLRKTGYLNNKGTVNQGHCSISGSTLDPELRYFETTCNKNLTIYLNGIQNGNRPGKNIQLTPVFTTMLDREKYNCIERKTKKQISIIIEEAIRNIHSKGNIDGAFILQEKWKHVKVKTKNDMLMFYKELIPIVENETAEEIDDEDSEDDAE